MTTTWIRAIGITLSIISSAFGFYLGMCLNKWIDRRRMEKRQKRLDLDDQGKNR